MSAAKMALTYQTQLSTRIIITVHPERGYGEEKKRKE
jgi:hypothetical protein